MSQNYAYFRKKTEQGKQRIIELSFTCSKSTIETLKKGVKYVQM